jgi:uncharacterized protein (TIGR03032 family)
MIPDETKSDPRELGFTRLFSSVLRAENCSLLLACNLPSGIAFIGRQENGKPFFQEVGEGDMVSVAVAGDGTFWTAEKNFVSKWENLSDTGGYKANGGSLYAQRLRIFTSNLGIRDMAVDGYGALLMACGAYSIIGRASTSSSFEPVWKPPFVTKTVREDRCGLSGLALFDSERHCATLWGKSDEANGWRQGFENEGCVMLLKDSSVFCDGLCLPLAPRWRNSELYLLNAGTAEFGKVDPATHRFIPICECPGYPTGLAFVGHWAVLSVCRRPPEGTSELDLPATKKFRAKNINPFSGIILVDLLTGDIAHHAYCESESFLANDIAILKATSSAMAFSSSDDRLDPLVTVARKSG